MQVDDPLVDPHFVAIPCLGALATRGLPGGDLQDLGWHSDRTLHTKLGFLGSANEVTTDWEEVKEGGGKGGIVNDPSTVSRIKR